MRAAVHRLKYGDRPGIAAALADLWLEWFELPPGALLAVPLHPGRQRRRGYNQAAELTGELARIEGREQVDGLVRKLPGEPQVGRDGTDRRLAMTDAFSWIGPPPPAAVVLIDDVITTGSTMLAAGAAVRQVGAATVFATALTQA